MQEDGMKDDDDEEYNDSEEDTELLKAKQALTGRGVTLSALMEDGIIQAGENVLSIDYRGQRFEADLLPNGKIRWQGSEEEFSTPSAWATHCKRLVNPIKRSGCGWASVKYKGRKLDTWKTVWSRKHHPNSPFRTTSPHQAAATEVQNGVSQTYHASQENGDAENRRQETELSQSVEARIPEASEPAVPTAVANGSSEKSFGNIYMQEVQEEALNLSMSGPHAGGKTNGDHPAETMEITKVTREKNSGLPLSSQRQSVVYASLGARSKDDDPNTFVKCEHFATLARTQPFTDFHCHLMTCEVAGYLGGQWSPQSQHVRITHVFPCKCRLDDQDKAPIVEDEIRKSMAKQGCSLVGWYHSHPFCQADPTLKDIDSQMSYQLCMKGPGGVYLPCVALIFSPFDRRATKAESAFESFWVMPPPELPSGYGMPMHMKCGVHHSSSLTEELLNEMNQLADYYRGFPDRTRWRELWGDQISYLEKLKGSLKPKLPKDQTESGSFFAFIQQLLLRK
ncbi:hypothetical protein BaRGS_00015497 [Batillaria attramentaria]|uniref:MPN domain-containing protein n=1 Tax=Batillaria attramentaria TaxID=370345 RepID=A0ABD0L2A2_9CAEN